LLWKRVSGRQGGASDANIEVLETQLARGLDKLAWRKIDASERVDVICGEILAGTEPDALKAESKNVPFGIMDPAI
jgi:predicted kinase